MTPDKTKAQVPDPEAPAIGALIARHERAVTGWILTATADPEAHAEYHAAKAAISAEFTRLAALRPGPSPQGAQTGRPDPIRLEFLDGKIVLEKTTGGAVRLEVEGHRGRVNVQYFGEAEACDIQKFLAAQYPAPTPSETLTATPSNGVSPKFQDRTVRTIYADSAGGRDKIITVPETLTAPVDREPKNCVICKIPLNPNAGWSTCLAHRHGTDMAPTKAGGQS